MEHIVTLTPEEETYLTTHGSTFDGIIDGLRTEWARGIASSNRQADLAKLEAVQDVPEVKAAVEAAVAKQAEEAVLAAKLSVEEPKP